MADQPEQTPAGQTPEDLDASIGQDAERAIEDAADAAARVADQATESAGDASDLEALQAAAAEAVAATGEADAAAGDSPQPFAVPDLEAGAKGDRRHEIDLLNDVALTVNIELGRTRMLVEDVLRLDEGAVVELDKLAGDPVDVYVNDRHVARGEVLVLNDNFCVRINEILTGIDEERASG
ncbi:MAG: flagellar motor switch protein FliN [Phycisphaerales bacterium]